ncbi:MAG: CDGSH iron-sulfur domain-containing protein [Geodermatophilaceae bacterium]|jgi:CDGSH-type Zn-finger protein|nr:CDGSH iron-sulfur domain-containing protein [Geodermatophilaceae bacterium]
MAEPHREIIVTDGPLLVSGPVEIVLPDGRRVKSDRPVTALCVCKRSRRQPFCDTSHRCRVRSGDNDQEEDRAQQETSSTG